MGIRRDAVIGAVALLFLRCEFADAATPQVTQAIAARKANYKEIGGDFKTLNDEIKSGAPDPNAVTSAARDIQRRSKLSLPYFVPGSGPESGEKTRAKADIWTNLADFTKWQENFIAAADRFAQTAEAGDAAAIATQFKVLGEACKSCHDKYRERE